MCPCVLASKFLVYRSSIKGLVGWEEDCVTSPKERLRRRLRKFVASFVCKINKIPVIFSNLGD